MRSVLDIAHNNIESILGDINLDDLAPDGGQYRPHIVWFEEDVPMILKAASMVEEADIFVVIGTSLAVYPAAGLVNYAPREIPKFIIDKNIPFTQSVLNLTSIEAPATIGMEKLQKLLLNS